MSIKIDYQKDYYDILQVSPSAGQKAIDAAYRRLAKKYHPDLTNNAPESTRRMQQINEARSILCSRTLRAQYDRWRSIKDFSQAAPSSQSEYGRYAQERQWREAAQRGEREAAARAAAQTEAQRVQKHPVWAKTLGWLAAYGKYVVATIILSAIGMQVFYAFASSNLSMDPLSSLILITFLLRLFSSASSR